MTEQVTGAIKHAVMGHGNDKIDQLKANIVEPSESTRITSDYGVKQNSTDNWLRVNSDDQTGASLLEDAFGREKVCHSIYRSFRFCATWNIWILMVYQDSSL
jgi:catalase